MTTRSSALRLLAVLSALLTAGAATAAPEAVASGGLDTGDMVAASLRMVAGLGVVLGLLGLTAWASRRFRLSTRLRGGPIEVTSGVSLGAREKVVLLTVGREQVLIGVSPAGMRTLHVLKDPAPAGFSEQFDQQLKASLEIRP